MPTNKFQPIEKGRDGAQRKLLPQIPKNKVGSFVRLLLGHGINVTARRVLAKELRPVQKNVNKDKIKEMQPFIYELVKKPFIVSREYYILDGHHTWVLAKENNEDFPLTAIVVDLPIKELIRVGRVFEGSHTKGINEAVNKGL
jgi:hypothetical protein